MAPEIENEKTLDLQPKKSGFRYVNLSPILSTCMDYFKLRENPS